MVTKRLSIALNAYLCSVLAKIHMVTKHDDSLDEHIKSSVLAKIHMVTKPDVKDSLAVFSSVLAKIHMVTKQA